MHTKNVANINKISITRATPADAATIMNIKREAWLSAYTDENLSITKADIIKKFGDMSVAIKN